MRLQHEHVAVNCCGLVNSVDAKSRPTADGERLYFGRLGDIWVTTRTR